MIVLGIDPGTVRIGYGVIEKNGGQCTYKECGILPIPLRTTRESILAAAQSFSALLARVNPSKVGIEKLFFSKNKKTALAVAETRGVLMHILLEQQKEVIEIAPSQMKKAITGNGNATKHAVAKMTRYFLNINSSSPKMIDDASDALALAICAAHSPRY